MKVLVALCLATLVQLGFAQASEKVELSVITHAPNWVNGRVSQRDLAGKVVLVDVYTFDCINCKHTEPNLRTLFHTTQRRDLIILGVHSPETRYERNRDNLLASLQEQGIAWPVAVDNDFTIWNRLGIQAWPTQLIFDRHGMLRNTVVGEGQDEEINKTIRQLIAEH